MAGRSEEGELRGEAGDEDVGSAKVFFSSTITLRGSY